MYEKKLTRNIIERIFFVSLVLEKKIKKSHNFKFGGTHYGTEAKWKVPKIVLYAHQCGQYTKQYPLFLSFCGKHKRTKQTQLLASTPKSNSITNG
jgi:hypothetical protein